MASADNAGNAAPSADNAGHVASPGERLHEWPSYNLGTVFNEATDRMFSINFKNRSYVGFDFVITGTFTSMLAEYLRGLPDSAHICFVIHGFKSNCESLIRHCFRWREQHSNMVVHIIAIDWEQMMDHSGVVWASIDSILEHGARFLTSSVEKSRALGRELTEVLRDRTVSVKKLEISALSHSMGSHAVVEMIKGGVDLSRNIYLNPHVFKQDIMRSRTYGVPTVIVMNENDKVLGWSAVVMKSSLGRSKKPWRVLRWMGVQRMTDITLASESCQVIYLRECEAVHYNDRLSHASYLNQSISHIYPAIFATRVPKTVIQTREALISDLAEASERGWLKCVIRPQQLDADKEQQIKLYLSEYSPELHNSCGVKVTYRHRSLEQRQQDGYYNCGCVNNTLAIA